MTYRIPRRRDIPSPPRYRVPFPDLRCPSACAPLSNRIAIPGSNTEVRKVHRATLPDFVVATTHKQGNSVHHKRELSYLGGRKI